MRLTRLGSPNLIAGLALAVICGSACSFNGETKLLNDAGAIDGGSDADVDAMPISAKPGFSDDYTVWTVPHSGTTGGFFDVKMELGNQWWFLRDLNGDGKLELLQTSNPAAQYMAWDDQDGQFWKVFEATATGFALEPTIVRLPPGPTIRGFFTVRGTGASSWDLLDLDGDNVLDIVELIDPATGAPWTDGNEISWKIFKGTDFGFAQESVWVIPDLGANTLEVVDFCGGTGCWQLLDLNDDGLPDLVHSSDGAVLEAWDSPSEPNWHVYLGEAGGFRSSFDKWFLPSHESTEGFFAAELGRYWKTMDLSGNGRLELVQTSPYPFGAGPFFDEADPIWRSYSSATNGFDMSAQSWSVPLGTASFDRTDEATGTLHWRTMDINGDGLPDLIHTANPTAATAAVWGSPSSDQWKVYLGQTVGFAPSVTTWPVPDSQENEGFYAPSESSGNRHWVTIDLDGDGQVELVQTADPSSGEVWLDDSGNPYWRVFRRDKQ